ncbi:MAG: alpha-amylase [Lachnospiraceae bacterium]|nr:alpha-amylase [Lachnospiraceae bacterium]
MAWFEEAIFYHIYPLGLTGAPKKNDYGEPVSRLTQLAPWIEHVKEIGCNAVYIGPLFESVGHGYETTDYKKLDSRLGTNEDLKKFVTDCHNMGIRVILDGVFNHTGRDFFAFKDMQKNRENSQYKDWYCNVNFYGNTEYNDGFSYENWGGYNLLVKLNQQNPQVREYIADVIRFWVKEFDIDGIRLDAADVLDFSFMKMLRAVANEVKEDFWLMGEVIHGDYNKWANDETLHSVTNYQLHKALYSGHNDHNYFEIAHTVKRLYEMFSGSGVKLYNFVDNHDVERINTKLQNKNHFTCVHIMLYTLPGIPSLYYGSEYGIDGRKERGSDDSLRPCLNIKEMPGENEKLSLISKLAKIRKQYPVLAAGSFEELRLTNRQYVFARAEGENRIYIAVNNDEAGCELCFPVRKAGNYVGLLSGKVYRAEGDMLHVSLPPESGEIWLEEGLRQTLAEKESIRVKTAEKKTIIEKQEQEAETRLEREAAERQQREQEEKARLEREAAERQQREQEEKDSPKREEWAVIDRSKSYEEMSIQELQAVIYEKMAKNGPVTDRMKQDILENVYHNSLVTWAKSF